MALTEQDQITYLANVIFVAHADSAISPKETAAIDEIRTTIGAKKGALNAALKAVLSGSYSPIRTGTFAEQVSNVADMLYVSFVDGEFDAAEKNALSEFCRKVGLTQDQLNLMVKEAITRLDRSKLTIKCPACSAEVSGDAKFCPKCGKTVSTKDVDPAPLAFKIPNTGYAIEFCDSSAAGFPAALDNAKTASSFTNIVRNKKTWYLASWSEESFEKASQLAQLLSGIKNRKSYHVGKEVPWDELFGFAWCASERSSAYRPVEYCFGKDENHVNPWGCKQVRMEWTDWSKWFSYGQFRRAGILKSTNVWVFDKERIRHEVMTNLHRYRYCPHLRQGLIEEILRVLPDEVEITANSPWKYSRSYEEVPGGVKIVEVEKNNGFEYKTEYYADGVRPKGLGSLEAILKKAFADAGVTDVTATQLVR